MLRGILDRWRARKNAQTESEYGHATLAERHDLDETSHGFGLEDSAERHMNEHLDATEGRPREDDLPRDAGL